MFDLVCIGNPVYDEIIKKIETVSNDLAIAKKELAGLNEPTVNERRNPAKE